MVYQFITGITFEVVLIVIFGIGYFVMAGTIHFGSSATQDFVDFRRRNGQIVRMICVMTIIVLLSSIISKYFMFVSDPMPTLER